VEHWHIDATFFAVPVGFYQMIVILVYDNDTDLYLPACFILCSRKNKEIYYKIFKYIFDNIIMDECKLKRITLDFEESLKEAAQEVFQHISFIGCKFHFNQAIMRKARKKGLLSVHNEKETKEIIQQFNFILEAGLKNLDEYLKTLHEEYVLKLQSLSQDRGQFFHSFYLK